MSQLHIENLRIEYALADDQLVAVDDVDLELEEATTMGLVGESGSGKTTVIKSILGLLDDNGRVVSGKVVFKGEDLTTMPEVEMNERIRWQEISYVPQNAMAALDPVYRVGSQIVEVIRRHTDQSKEAARERAAQLFRRVDLDESRLNDYPHQLSGGQRQRVVIALALALEPSLIIADEPTTGLDVIVQDAILELLADIQADLGCSILTVTHDMSVVAEMADEIAVMYGGWIMESGDTRDVLKETTNPYTIGLKNAFPTLDSDPSMAELISIPGSPPSLNPPPVGCRFANRCPFATDTCRREEPPMLSVGGGQRSKCHYSDNSPELRARGERAEMWRAIDE